LLQQTGYTHKGGVKRSSSENFSEVLVTCVNVGVLDSQKMQIAPTHTHTYY